MTLPQLQVQADGHLHLSGELSMATVPALLAGQKPFALVTDADPAATVIIDLAGVTRADSAGLALLIQWQREAQARQRGIRFQHIPAQMLAMARLSGVDQLLALN
jgi:phospholipid transport system transporter-binding protein